MKALIIDTETTGLLKHPDAKRNLQPRVIEFGALLIDVKGKEIESCDFLINPGVSISDEITRITGITNDDLRDKPPFSQMADAISSLIEKANIVIAHNLPFDMGVLNREAALINKQLPWPPVRLCTVQENVPFFGYRPTLKELYQAVTGHPLTQTHRAIDDCRALAEIVIEAQYLASLT